MSKSFLLLFFKKDVLICVGPRSATRAATLLASALPLMAMDTPTAIVRQQNRTFSVEALRIPVGGAIRFSNEDEFEHEVYVDTPNFAYDSEEQEPGDSVTVHFTRAGSFPVRCHIHPKMHLQIDVVDGN